MTYVPVKNALISVFDKSGLEPLCQALAEHGVTVFSTEGTGSYLEKNLGVPVKRIEALTQFPEMMDGRVKTLHPRIFGGILARRDHKKDIEEAAKYEVPLFDLVIVNLYPFWDHLGETVDQQVPFIDIGGPSMIRAASKNFAAVTVLSSPDDYPAFIEEMAKHKGSTSREFRHRLAAQTFARTSEYDGAIAAQWLKESAVPTSLPLAPQSPLRYGENPHQRAAWCGTKHWQVIQGKELSYNNLLDAEAAVRLAQEFKEPSLAIVKHNNPCGAAAGNLPLADLFKRALSTDSKSAFGGIIATNSQIDGASALAMSELFLEVVIAPGFDPEALEIFSRKKNLRLIAWPKVTASPFEVRAALGGWLVQEGDNAGIPPDLKTVTQAEVPKHVLEDLKFAWLVTKHVRSNAIVLAKNQTTLGIGAGQMSRVDAVTIALAKCPQAETRGAVLASDAFFPFRDNIDLLKGKEIAAIIQPGGSQRDAEVIQACDELGIAMVFTGERHFRH